jgi:hypothetical protein
MNCDDKVSKKIITLPSIAAHAREHGIVPSKKLGQTFL